MRASMGEVTISQGRLNQPSKSTLSTGLPKLHLYSHEYQLPVIQF